MSETISGPRESIETAGATKKWFFKNFHSTDDVLAFVNGAPAQGPGEISATARNDGTVGLFYFSNQA